MARRVVWPAGLAVLVFLVSVGIRLTHLDLYSTTDEGYWIQRSLRFGAALARGDLDSTFRAGHPGVTVMWAGLLGIGPGRLQPFLPERFAQYNVLERAPGYLDAFSAARRAVAILASALITVAVLLCWRLFGPGPALASGALLTLDPYVIGMTRLLHVDALLAPLMLVSVLAGLIVWTGAPRSRWPYLALSAVSGGLALLTKAPAALLPAYFGLVAIAAMSGAGRICWRRLWHTFLPLGVWGAVAAGVYVLLFPALWVNPVLRIQQLSDFVQAVGLQPHNGNFFLGRATLDDPGLLYYALALPLRMSPLAAVGVGLLVLKAPAGNTATRWLLAYTLLFTLMMTLASKKFDRYMLPVLTALDVLAGVGLWRLVSLSLERWSAEQRVGRPVTPGWQPSSRQSPSLLAVALAGVLAAGQVVLLLRAWPYPVAYYNPLAGGPQRARELIMVGWGEGLEQVADFLNSLPDADQSIVVSSYNHVLRPRFRGVTLPTAPYARGAAGLPMPDYMVLYVNTVQRQQISPEVQLAQAHGTLVFTAHVNGQEYAWVYQMPRTGPRPTAPVTIDESGEPEEN
ncbi:MAG: ArnT family glycosyltransferase [Chloroflexota bacterium]